MKRKLIGVILMAVMVCSLAACGSKETKETKADADKSGTPVLRVMFSELLTIIPGFLVLSIPMNLLKSRKRVRQRAPRFREFHLHSTKRNLS